MTAQISETGALLITPGLVTVLRREFRLEWQGTSGRDHDDVTVRTCWDADRLDLARVGISPEPGRLCTAAARDPESILRASLNATKWVARYLERLPPAWCEQPRNPAVTACSAPAPLRTPPPRAP